MKNQSLNLDRVAVIWGFILIGLLCSCNYGQNDVDDLVGLKPFRQIARDANCADITNRLFLIDEEMVFWDRRGNCRDAAYAYTLYGRTVDDILCYLWDSAAGSQSSCQDDFENMFDTITANLDEPDLGLGENHQVEEISF